MEALGTYAPAIVLALSAVAAMIGALGGLGGAVILVPILVLMGATPLEAAPIGMAMVAAGALASATVQTRSELANYRLGVTMESAAGVGAVAGALISVFIAPRALMYVLAIATIISAVASGSRTGQRNLPVDGALMRDFHDRPGTLSDAYRDEQGRVIPYNARRVPLGLGLMGSAGLIAGMTGSSGGYIKTPVMSEVMHVPVKAAAATTAFMVSITAAAALTVYALQGRVTASIAPAVVGGFLGGRIGAALQPRLRAVTLRHVIAVLLVVIGLVVLVNA